jgi:hypothetical protein
VQPLSAKLPIPVGALCIDGEPSATTITKQRKTDRPLNLIGLQL